MLHSYNTFCHILLFPFQFQNPMQLKQHFFLKARKLEDVKIMNIKKELTILEVTAPKGQNFTQENYAVLLGKELFDKGEVKRINEGKVITKTNVVLSTSGCAKTYVRLSRKSRNLVWTCKS